MATKINPKLKLARKMMTSKERCKKISPFDSKNWNARKLAKLKKTWI